MSDLKVGEFLERLREAELMGALKAFTWLSFEVSGARGEDLTVEDIVDTVHQTLGLINEKVWDKFNVQYGIFYPLKDRVKKRKGEKKDE